MRYKIFDQELKKEMGSKKIIATYLMVQCEECGAKWGITIREDEVVTTRNLVCRNCLLDKYVNE